MMDNAASAKFFFALLEADPDTRHFWRRKTVSTYSEFLDVLKDDLLAAVLRLERNPQLHWEESEDETTMHIVDMLSVMGYGASQSNVGGNVDLVVELQRQQRFMWLGEAKKFGDVGDLREGFLQLSTRYRPQIADDGQLHGGLIAYLRRPNAVKCVKSWREHLPTVIAGCAIEDCERRGAIGFVSSHAHESTGLPLRVWHVCAVLHHDPLDASGRSAQKYQERRAA